MAWIMFALFYASFQCNSSNEFKIDHNGILENYIRIDSVRKLVITVGSVVSLLLIVILIVALGRKMACSIQDHKPGVSETAHKAIPSQDNRALVHFAGYLASKPDENRIVEYLGLTLQGVRISVRDGFTHLILDADCSVLDLKVEKTSTQYILRGITIEPKVPHTKLGKCRVILRQEFARDQYWSCKDNYYDCIEYGSSDLTNATSSSKNSQLTGWATFGFEFLEFELDGNPLELEYDQFSKNPKMCHSK